MRSDRTSCSVRVLAGAFRMRCSAPVVSDRFSVPSCDCAAVSAGLCRFGDARGLLRRRRTGSDARCVRRRCRRRVRSARRVLIECCARCVSPLRSVPCSQWSVSGGFDDLDGRGQSVAASRKVSFSGASRCSTRCPDLQSAPLGTARCPFVRTSGRVPAGGGRQGLRRSCGAVRLEPFGGLPSCDSRRHAGCRRGAGEAPGDRIGSRLSAPARRGRSVSGVRRSARWGGGVHAALLDPDRAVAVLVDPAESGNAASAGAKVRLQGTCHPESTFYETKAKFSLAKIFPGIGSTDPSL